MEHSEKKHGKKKVWKSVLAVVSGFLTVVILSVVTDFIMEALTIFPPANRPDLYVSWMLGLALVYRLAFNVAGGYVTAKLAPTNPMKHVKVLAILGTIGGLLGVIAAWNMSENWYPIALAALSYVTVWYGGKLWVKKHNRA